MIGLIHRFKSKAILIFVCFANQNYLKYRISFINLYFYISIIHFIKLKNRCYFKWF